VRRREFIAGLAAVAWPVVARAQGERVRRVGVLMNGAPTDEELQSYLAAFTDELRRLGWNNGANLRVEVRWSGEDGRLARANSAQLIESMPDVILATTTANLTEIVKITSAVPVIFVQVADPVAQGFVASVKRPGGNITGFTNLEFSIGSKWLDLLKKIAPSLSRVACIFNPDASPQSKFYMQAIEDAAPSLGIQVVAMLVRVTAHIETVVAEFARSPNGGLIVLGGAFNRLGSSLIADLAVHHHLPSIAAQPGFVKEGGLMEYGVEVSTIGQYRQAANYVDHILKGARPADLPVQGADRYRFAINLKTANALGLTIPETLLATADEVIQ
jgi:putative tryptophan/tyrosine transport system substrate-binding protein